MYFAGTHIDKMRILKHIQVFMTDLKKLMSFMLLLL